MGSDTDSTASWLTRKLTAIACDIIKLANVSIEIATQ